MMSELRKEVAKAVADIARLLIDKEVTGQAAERLAEIAGKLRKANDE